VRKPDKQTDKQTDRQTDRETNAAENHTPRLLSAWIISLGLMFFIIVFQLVSLCVCACVYYHCLFLSIYASVCDISYVVKRGRSD